MIRSHIFAAAVVASASVSALSGCNEKKEAAQAPSAAAPAPSAQKPAAPADEAQLVAQGEKLFTALGCNACHSADGSMRVGPTLMGLYGKQVELTDGTTVTADDAYLKTAILEPSKQVVKGYVPTMPTYKGRLDDSEVDALVAWIKSLK